MWLYSIYGTGVTIHGVRPSVEEDGRVELTTWLSLFWIPLIPLASWSVRYAGETLGDGVTDNSHRFLDGKPIPHDWACLLQTFARGLVALAVAVAPAAYIIWRINGRAANHVETTLAIASAFWPVGLVFYANLRRTQKLRQARQKSSGQSDRIRLYRASVSRWGSLR